MKAVSLALKGEALREVLRAEEERRATEAIVRILENAGLVKVGSRKEGRKDSKKGAMPGKKYEVGVTGPDTPLHGSYITLGGSCVREYQWAPRTYGTAT